jgi:hypothetical protein
MKRVAAILKRAKPDIRMMLELITRDPLKVPCLTRTFSSLWGGFSPDAKLKTA